MNEDRESNITLSGNGKYKYIHMHKIIAELISATLLLITLFISLNKSFIVLTCPVSHPCSAKTSATPQKMKDD